MPDELSKGGEQRIWAGDFANAANARAKVWFVFTSPQLWRGFAAFGKSRTERLYVTTRRVGSIVAAEILNEVRHGHASRRSSSHFLEPYTVVSLL